MLGSLKRVIWLVDIMAYFMINQLDPILHQAYCINGGAPRWRIWMLWNSNNANLKPDIKWSRSCTMFCNNYCNHPHLNFIDDFRYRCKYWFLVTFCHFITFHIFWHILFSFRNCNWKFDIFLLNNKSMQDCVLCFFVLFCSCFHH